VFHEFIGDSQYVQLIYRWTDGDKQHRRTWVVGTWRPKRASTTEMLSLQAGWPAVITDLSLGPGFTVELVQDGHETMPDDTTRPRILMRLERPPGAPSPAALPPTPLPPGYLPHPTLAGFALPPVPLRAPAPATRTLAVLAHTALASDASTPFVFRAPAPPAPPGKPV
jgi:hypothetical protein